MRKTPTLYIISISDLLKSSPPLPCLGNYSLKNYKCPFSMLRKTAQETRTVDPFTCDSIHSDVCACVLLTIYAFTVCTHLECNVLLWSAMPCSTAWSWPPVLLPEDETDTTPTFSMPICLALFIDKQYIINWKRNPPSLHSHSMRNRSQNAQTQDKLWIHRPTLYCGKSYMTLGLAPQDS